MRLELGNRGDYTVRAVLYLARHPGRQRRQDIAASMGIPDTFLPQLMAALVRAGIVRSTVGRHGGFELARPADEVTIREVVEIAEGPIHRQVCALRGGPCYWAETKCAIHDAWVAAEDALIGQLDRTTFAELARADEALERAGDPGHSHRSPRPAA